MFASQQRRPSLYCAAFNAKTGNAVVVLTNATSHDWAFPLDVVQGRPRPSYWIAPERGIPGWFGEFEEGIAGVGWIYSRDSSGRYVRSDLTGHIHRVTGLFTNVVLHPREFLSFSYRSAMCVDSQRSE